MMRKTPKPDIGTVEFGLSRRDALLGGAAFFTTGG
jgi:hypothetical protein